MCDLNYFQLSIFFGISDITVAKYKPFLLVCYKGYFEKRFVLLGGCGITIEVDESVLSRKGIIINSTSVDDTGDTIWILGGIDQNRREKFLSS